MSALLRRHREAKGLTRQQVATALEISERTVIRHEKPGKRPRRVDLVAYADLYKIPLRTLLEEIGEEKAA